MTPWARVYKMSGPARGVVSTPADHFTPAYREASMPTQGTPTHAAKQPVAPTFKDCRLCGKPFRVKPSHYHIKTYCNVECMRVTAAVASR